MKTFFEEFKAFAMRGNVLDLAVAVVIGGAFGKIVSSLVDTIVMPSIGLLLGGMNFTHWEFKLGDSVIAYGKFVQSIVDFIIIALAIFVMLRLMNRVLKKKEKEEKKAAKDSEEVLLLREIRDALVKK